MKMIKLSPLLTLAFLIIASSSCDSDDQPKTCGNDHLESYEDCEDGNLLEGDGCSSTCRIEPFWECPWGYDCKPICGDGVIMSPHESCDGLFLNDQTCASLGYTGGSLACETFCRHDIANCTYTVEQISPGLVHSCILLENGLVRCFGDPDYLGNAGNTDSGPVTVQGITNAIAVHAGGDQTYVALADGTARAWGGNWYGELGIGSESDMEPTPLLIPNLNNVVAFSSGYGFACALNNLGEVYCWGRNGAGQLGNYLQDDTMAPGRRAVEQAVEICSGSSFTCARLREDHQYFESNLVCWGDNREGQIGDWQTDGCFTSPNDLEDLPRVTSISCGYDSACAVLPDHTVKCWGGASYNFMPRTVEGLSDVSRVAVGSDHACALLMNGQIKCWGSSEYGQTGTGGLHGAVASPTAITKLSQYTQLEAGNYSTCAVNANGVAYCWGSNEYGQLGDGTEVDRADPVGVLP